MKSCLVVDDSSVIRKVARRILEGMHFEITEAEDGEQALGACRRQLPDAILLDWNMPKMDGFELLSVCRMKWPGIPVVVFSAEQNDLAHEAVERGAFAWVRKGNEFTLLLEFLDYAIHQSVHA